MAGKIIIADRDSHYAEALALRVRQHHSGWQVTAVFNDSAYAAQVKTATEPIILIVSESHFPIDNLPSAVSQVIPLCSRGWQTEPTQSDQPVRMGSVLPILKRLDLVFAQTAAASPQQAGRPVYRNDLIMETLPEPPRKVEPPHHVNHPHQVDPSQHTEPSGTGTLQQSSVPRILLLMTQTTGGRLNHYADHRCQALSSAGSRIYYLPLMPNYYCRQWSAADSGSGLTDLLLRISAGGLSAQALGTFSAMDPLGRIQFRPTDRADDLLQCRTEDLYRLCVMLRERIQGESASMLVIETAGMAFHQIRAILPLCDQVEVIIPEGSDYAADVLRREISDILADLPSISQVVRIPERSTAGLKAPVISGEGRAYGKT